RHTVFSRDWSADVGSSVLRADREALAEALRAEQEKEFQEFAERVHPELFESRDPAQGEAVTKENRDEERQVHQGPEVRQEGGQRSEERRVGTEWGSAWGLV